ncbi:STAS domain-containing protein [Streptomyces sp. Marseille-Q5077]|uniref:STAS domain-containing protein n=1 Tax=Streptomyces sp. Marseille-Q5077 TaxID=3418995 RepID=UPI003CFBD4EF
MLLLDTDGCGVRILRPAPGASLEGTGWVLCPAAQGLPDRPLLCLRRKYAPAGSAPRVPELRLTVPLPDGLPNRGVMPLSQLTLYRHDQRKQALIALSGEIDLESAQLVRESLEQCLRDGIRTIDVDLTFCHCSGLDACLDTAQQTTVAGGRLRLHHPPTTLARILDLAGCGLLLLGLPFGHLPPPRGDTPTAPRPAPPHRSVPPAPVLSGDVR